MLDNTIRKSRHYECLCILYAQILRKKSNRCSWFGNFQSHKWFVDASLCSTFVWAYRANYPEQRRSTYVVIQTWVRCWHKLGTVEEPPWFLTPTSGISAILNLVKNRQAWSLRCPQLIKSFADHHGWELTCPFQKKRESNSTPCVVISALWQMFDYRTIVAISSGCLEVTGSVARSVPVGESNCSHYLRSSSV